MPSTDLVYGGIRLRARYSTPDTDMADGGICLGVRYVMPSTDTTHAATSHKHFEKARVAARECLSLDPGTVSAYVHATPCPGLPYCTVLSYGRCLY